MTRFLTTVGNRGILPLLSAFPSGSPARKEATEMASSEKPAKRKGHAFHIATKPHVMKVTDDWSHHREIYVSTGDVEAYRQMLASVALEDGDQQ